MIDVWVKKTNTTEAYIPLRDQIQGKNSQQNLRTSTNTYKLEKLFMV